MQRKWTSTEEEYLFTYFGSMNDNDIAFNLQRSIKSVLKKVERMKLTKSIRNEWTKEELNILKKNFHLSYQKLQELLPKHPLGSILGKGYFIGIFRHNDPSKGLSNENLTICEDDIKTMSYVKKIERQLGKRLEKGQVVHHIDMVGQNNDINNLHVFPNQSEHARSHASLNRLAKPLLDKGIIIFDYEFGIYKLNSLQKNGEP